MSPCGGFQIAVVAIEILDGLGQLFLKLPHLRGEVVDPVLPDEADARLRVGQAQRLPEGDDLAAHGGHRLEARRGVVQQLLASGQKLRFGPERFGGLGLLLGAQAAADAEPTDGNADRRHRPAESLRRSRGGRGRFIENSTHKLDSWV